MSFTVQNLVLCNSFIILGSMVSTWLAHKNLIGKFTANTIISHTVQVSWVQL